MGKFSNNSLNKTLCNLTGLGILAGLVLTFLSWTGVCSTSCAEGHSYNLFGMPFEWTGVLFFSFLLIMFIFSKKFYIASLITGLLLAAGTGAEVMFILIQKYIIGSWCPICLSIAAALMFSAIAWGCSALIELRWIIEKGLRRDILDRTKRMLAICSTVFLGVIVTFFGVTKVDELQESESTFQQQIAFIDANEKTDEEPIEIYVFTSWICPACQRFEPKLERMFPDIIKKAKVIFVDYGVDDITLNYLPYNLSFMLHNKDKYIELRTMLKEMSKTKMEPTDKEVEVAALELGVSYKQLNYSEVVAGIECYKDLATNLKVKYLPSFVILNPEKRKKQELTGTEVTLTNIYDAIAEVSK